MQYKLRSRPRPRSAPRVGTPNAMAAKALLAVACWITLGQVGANNASSSEMSKLTDSAASATLMTSFYSGTPLTVYASGAPHGAYSFHAPTYRIPPKNIGPTIPVQHEKLVIHNQNGYLKDSYGNHFVESPQSVAYKTMFPQQFVPLQELPSHLAQPLLAASPGIHFKETVPHFSYGSPVRVSQYYQAPVRYSSPTPTLTFKGPEHFYPAAYAEKTLRISAPLQERYTHVAPKQEPSNHQVVYSDNVYKSHKAQPIGFQRLEQLPKSHVGHGGNDQRNHKEQKNKLSHQKANLSKSPHQVTVINDGKKTVVSFTTRPPLPLIDIDLLQPLVFENPIVPQVQHFLPRINYVTYDKLPQSQNRDEPKKQKKVHVQSFYSAIVNKPQTVSSGEENQKRDPEQEEYSKEPTSPASDENSAEDEGPNEDFIPLVLDEDFHDERARQNDYDRTPVSSLRDYNETPEISIREQHRSHPSTQDHQQPKPLPREQYESHSPSRNQPPYDHQKFKPLSNEQHEPHLRPRDHPPYDHQKSKPLPREQYKSHSPSHDQPPPRPSAHEEYNSRPSSRDGHHHQHHEHTHPRPTPHTQHESEPPSREEHSSPQDHHVSHQALPHDKHYSKSSLQEQPQTRLLKSTNEPPIEHHFYVEEHNPKPFSYSVQHHQPQSERQQQTVSYHPKHYVEKQPTRQEQNPPPNANVEQDVVPEWIPKLEPIKLRPLEIIQEVWHEPQKASPSPQSEEEYIKLQFEKQQQAFEPAPRQPPPRNPQVTHVKEKMKQVIIEEEEEPQEMHEHREKIIAEMMKQEDNNEEDFEKAYHEAAYGFPAYGRNSEEEKDIYNPSNYGIAREHEDYDFENTPFQKYVHEGDQFPKSSRLGYKDERDHNKEEYFLDFAVKKPESMLDRFKKKENYFKLYKKSHPEDYFTSGKNKKSKHQPKKNEKYVVDYDYHPAGNRDSKNAFSASYRVKPKFGYSYDKEAPKHNGLSHDSRPSPTFNKWRTTHFVEPQFQYGFEPIPRVLDGELSAMASSDSPEREKPGTRKKIYKENWYIHKTSTSAGTPDS